MSTRFVGVVTSGGNRVSRRLALAAFGGVAAQNGDDFHGLDHQKGWQERPDVIQRLQVAEGQEESR